LTPTVLSLLGFDTAGAGFDGTNVLSSIPSDRKVYFSAGWMHQGPAGFVKGPRKLIYHPTNQTVSMYDLSSDPHELINLDLSESEAQRIARDIVAWRKNSIFGRSGPLRSNIKTQIDIAFHKDAGDQPASTRPDLF